MSTVAWLTRTVGMPLAVIAGFGAGTTYYGFAYDSTRFGVIAVAIVGTLIALVLTGPLWRLARARKVAAHLGMRFSVGGPHAQSFGLSTFPFITMGGSAADPRRCSRRVRSMDIRFRAFWFSTEAELPSMATGSR